MASHPDGNGATSSVAMNGGSIATYTASQLPTVGDADHPATRPRGADRRRRRLSSGLQTWEKPGWGTSRTVTLAKGGAGQGAHGSHGGGGGGLIQVGGSSDAPGVDASALPAPAHAAGPPLGQFLATSIAGNDLLSSVLYTAGICVQYSGKLAPFALLLVSAMLYFFRSVYSEVVTALPVNGGSYNALLNTTSKRAAAVASCLSMLSYVATAVVSAYSAVAYVEPLWDYAGTPSGSAAGTVGLLGVFALLSLVGMGESALVATGMFFLHLVTLSVVAVYCIVYAVRDGGATLAANWATPYPDILTSDGTFVAPGSIPAALFFGYAAALLGITGFETAANYVEEMADARTYVATLRNMWIAAGVFNPLIAAVAQGVLPMEDMYANSSNLLAALAMKAGGPGLRTFLCIDGAIVLAGSVLTAYVGITGLVRRLALDRVLPPVLLHTNACRGTNHWIILSFFGLTASLYLLLAAVSADATAAMNNLAGVYGISFLSVMSAFALAAMALKWKRPDLPRLVISSWGTVVAALVAVLIGLAGTIAKGPAVLGWFAAYFVAVVSGRGGGKQNGNNKRHTAVKERGNGCA